MPNQRLITFLFLLVGFFIFYLGSIGIKNIFRYNKFQLETQSLATELHKETAIQTEYKRELAAMCRPEYWQQLAQKRLGLVNKGEVVYKIIIMGARK